MCAYQKTCIYPDPNIDNVLSKPILKMIVVGNYSDIVRAADNLALYPPMNTARHVIWYPAISANELRTKFPGLTNVENIKAFSLSKSNKVGDIITKNETADLVRIDLCFTRAGAAALN